mmetsp:Transcript_98337/g.174296  ORF Transcript_98337/g.174296 Transcript_98337/m.174296 type:complete len:172 (-) Transcript_98337:129-644(-)
MNRQSSIESHADSEVQTDPEVTSESSQPTGVALGLMCGESSMDLHYDDFTASAVKKVPAKSRPQRTSGYISLGEASAASRSTSPRGELSSRGTSTSVGSRSASHAELNSQGETGTPVGTFTGLIYSDTSLDLHMTSEPRISISPARGKMGKSRTAGQSNFECRHSEQLLFA